MPIEPASASAAAKAYKATKVAIPIISNIWNWYKANHVLKAKRRTLGIAIAVAAETEEQMPQITHDFIDKLKSLAKRDALAKSLSIVVVPPGPSKKATGPEGRRRLLDRTECVLLISVFARIRRSKGEEQHVLDFESMVKHEAIANEVSAVLAQEMIQLLAHRRHISRANDLDEFEWNAASVHLAALYVISVAAILSHKPEYAFLLLGELNEQLKELRGHEQPRAVRKTLQQLKERLPFNLAIAHLEASQILFAQWRKTRDVGLMDDFASHLQAAGGLYPKMEFVWNGRAVYHVVRNRDIRAARAELNKFKAARSKNSLWRFSLGFTYAYEGNMRQAVPLYRTARGLTHDMRIILEVEEFLEWMLGEEPNKVQLHFVLGLINQHGKGDPGPALDHYRTFLSEGSEEQFPEQREVARRFIEEQS